MNKSKYFIKERKKAEIIRSLDKERKKENLPLMRLYIK